MKKKNQIRPYINRLIIVLVISVILVTIFNEAAYLMQKEKSDRAPQTIELAIPAGTAARVEAGEDVPAIPQEMTFVLGDTLQVTNYDSVSHQLGPIWVPAGSSASLVMENAEKYAYSCSFATSRYLGLDVRQPTTLATRLTALGLAAPTMTVLFFIYSILIFPVKTPEPLETAGQSGQG
jgi:hypothetical protein